VEKSFKAVKIYSGDVYVYVGSAVKKVMLCYYLMNNNISETNSSSDFYLTAKFNFSQITFSATEQMSCTVTV